MYEFDYYNPQTVAEALDVLQDTKESNRIIAGGTDVLIQINDGRIRAEHLINISGIRGLHGIRETNQSIRIGAATTFREITSHPLIQEKVPALYEACAHVGSPQVRALGTIGGNVMNASVAGDGITALLSLDAELVIESMDDVRILPLRDYYEGGSGTAIQPNELLTEIRFAKPDKEVANAFFKLGKRNALAIVDIGAGICIQKNKAGICTKARVIGGALSRFPLELVTVEQYLEGKPVSRQVFEQTYELLGAAVYESIKSRPQEVYFKMEAVKGAFEIVFEAVLKQYEQRDLTQQREQEARMSLPA